MSLHEYAISICIPTFNRHHYLKESLDVLLPQAQRLGVEVCVSDNYSSDETVKYLTEMSGHFSTLRFVVQNENIGLDKNMAAAISMGKGRYIYPLGDDDVLPKGSLSVILNEVNSGSNIDVIILNGWHTDPFISPVRVHLPSDIQGRIFISPESAFYSLWDKMPFGSFLAARNCFLAHYFDRFIGTSHAYTGAVWDALSEKYQESGKCKVKCMTIPTVLLRGAEKAWRNDAARIMLYEIPLWFRMMANLYQDVVENILNDYLKIHMHYLNLLQYRAAGQLDNKLVSELKVIQSVKQRIATTIIANTPKIAASSYCKGFIVLHRIYKWMKNQINRE